MKTILIVISKDIIRRNILDTNFWATFVGQNKDNRIILLVEEGKKKYFEKNFSDKNVFVEEYNRKPYNGLAKLVIFLVRTGIRSHSVTLYRKRAWRRGTASFFSSVLKGMISFTLARFKWYKKVVRFFVLKLHVPKEIKDVFDKYCFDVVFTPSLIDVDFDTLVAVEAKKRKIRLVGMVRSWDNLNNHGLLTVVPDRFIVQNVWLKECAEKFQAIKKDFIKDIIGLPHYDLYSNISSYIKPKDMFFKELDLDPSKKLILLGGSDFYYSEDVLPAVFNELISSKKIKEPVQVLFRPHPASLFSVDDYILHSLENIKLDTNFSDKKNTSFSDTENFINILYYADIIVNIASTLSIDAAVFDKPTICINFDDLGKKISRWESVHRLYDYFDHYERLIEIGGVRIPKSANELSQDINEYLIDGSIDSKERKNILNVFVNPFDGKSGKRLSEILSQEIFTA